MSITLYHPRFWLYKPAIKGCISTKNLRIILAVIQVNYIYIYIYTHTAHA